MKWTTFNANDFKKSSKGPLSTSSQTTFEDEHCNDWRDLALKNNRKTKNDRNSYGKHDNKGEMSPLNTSGSSLTEEIFNTALSNLEFLSDEEHSDDLINDRKSSTTFCENIELSSLKI